VTEKTLPPMRLELGHKEEPVVNMTMNNESQPARLSAWKEQFTIFTIE